jgi:hypothetical protein
MITSMSFAISSSDQAVKSTKNLLMKVIPGPIQKDPPSLK